MAIEAAALPALRTALLRWHRRHALQAPWRESGDPYHVLVAAVMAQQTQMSRVLPKFDEFIAAFPTVDALAAASTAGVLRAWAPLGYNMRALRLQRAARRIVELGGFPRRAAELQQIEGIGPFSAAIIASFAFGEPGAAIDTNVVRVLSRLVGGANASLPDRTLHALAEQLVSRRAPGRWNQALMDLGAVVCTARAPRCEACPIARWCRARPLFARSDLTPSPFPKGKGDTLAAGEGFRRVAEGRASYKTKPAFAGSRRYYRGRIVQALRELPPGASLSRRQLLARLNNGPAGQAEACPTENVGTGRASTRHSDGLDEVRLRTLLAALRRDGLVRIERNRVQLP